MGYSKGGGGYHSTIGTLIVSWIKYFIDHDNSYYTYFKGSLFEQNINSYSRYYDNNL